MGDRHSGPTRRTGLQERIMSDSEGSSQQTKAIATVGYMVCSSLMLMVNKLSVHHLPKPGVVLLFQFISSAVFAKTLGVTGIAEVDALTVDKAKKFAPAVCAQLGTIFSGVKALQYSNVETFIVFRASVPIILAGLEYKFLGRELPGSRSTICLLGLLVGTLLYTFTDSSFEIHGYKWIAIWYCFFTLDQAYLKHVVETVPMTAFGGVYYQNTLGSVGLLAISFAAGELETSLAPSTWGMNVWLPLLSSCVLGMGLSAFAYRLRKMTSATVFAILGNVCKVATVILNWLIWDKHCSPTGLMGLTLCLVCAYFYKPAAKRSDSDAVKNVAKTDEVDDG